MDRGDVVILTLPGVEEPNLALVMDNLPGDGTVNLFVLPDLTIVNTFASYCSALGKPGDVCKWIAGAYTRSNYLFFDLAKDSKPQPPKPGDAPDTGESGGTGDAGGKPPPSGPQTPPPPRPPKPRVEAL
jgi:hypothetical protein